MVATVRREPHLGRLRLVPFIKGRPERRLCREGEVITYIRYTQVDVLVYIHEIYHVYINVTTQGG